MINFLLGIVTCAFAMFLYKKLKESQAKKQARRDSYER